MTKFDRVACVAAFAAMMSFTNFSQAAVTVLIDGTAYPAELRDNALLLARIHARHSSNTRHVEGELRGVPGSWIRASMIGKRWQGVVALDGRHFVIDSPDKHNHSGGLWLNAQSPQALAAEASCATDEPTKRIKIGAAQFATAQANFATLCQTTVNGVCLLAELEIAFDLLFQKRFPTTYRDQAAALLNIVDGFYKNDLNTKFDAITMEFLTTDLFDTTTNSGDLLIDINNKKNNNQIPFVKNKRAILHLVTGRDFDTTTVGIASTGSLCMINNNSGTSQFIQSTGLTALVIAHEIGHNFGAGHDGDAGRTCPAGFIMAPSLSLSASHFSSCSTDDMTTGISGLSNIAACFEYPVDASLVARPGNPTTAGANENFVLSYDLSEAHASVASMQLNAVGASSGVGGTFIAVRMNGMACPIMAGGASYNCSTTSAGGLLEVTARATGGGSFTVQSTVTVNPFGEVKDIDSRNDTVSSRILVGTPPMAPSQLTALPNSTGALRIDLTWRDNSTDENGFRVERQAGSGTFQQIATPSANVTSYSDDGSLATGVNYTYRVTAFGAGGTSDAATSGGTQLVRASSAVVASTAGGGGAFGIELAPLLLLAARRRRSAADKDC